MPQQKLFMSAYSVRTAKPAKQYGIPSVLPVRQGRTEVYGRVPIAQIPDDAVVTNAVLRIFSRGTFASRTIRVAGINEGWGSKIRWNNRPAAGPIIDTVTKAATAARTVFEFDVTDWVLERSPRGLRVDSTVSGAPPARFHGSGTEDGPILLVDYFIPAEQPGNLSPDGGIVSTAKPILSYVGEDGMTAQQVQFSDDGSTPTYTSAWTPATEGRFEPTASTPAATSDPIFWRVRTRSDDGESGWSDWATYSYVALPTVTITNPPAITNDGSPALTWTATGQQSWKAVFSTGRRYLDSTEWRNEPGTRSWTPSRAVKTPGGSGQFTLHVRDSVSPRLGAPGAPTEVRVVQEFSTALTGSGLGVNFVNFSPEDPEARLTGGRTAGVPDEVALYRDGVQVPLWTAEGEPMMWAPGVDFFSGTTFTLPDYTAAPATDHTWTVRTRVNGQPSQASAAVQGRVHTASAWLLDPSDGRRVEILGIGDRPSVEQTTTEEAVVHLPINAGLEAEHTRRRLIRSTAHGTIAGAASTEHADILTEWAEADAGTVYRLIFGRVNWPVILGDYSPVEEIYGQRCAPGHVGFTLNWWQRRSDY